MVTTAGTVRPLLVTCLVAFVASQAPSRDADLCSESVAQCRERAVKGDGGALYGLGLLHARGKHADEGVAASMPETFKLWRRAAAGGHVLAMRDLAVLYHRGLGVEQSKSDAAHWFGLAAQQGDPESQYSLALLHGKGQGVERSMEKAAELLQRAAKQGHSGANRDLGVMLEKQGAVAEAADHYRTAADTTQADGGDDYAQYRLAMLYERGRGGVSRDASKAARWHRAAAEQGNALAQYSLGWLYQDGIGVKQNLTLAKRWFHFAAEQKHAGAQYSVAWRYLKGQGTARNATKAAGWFLEASQQGHAGAMFSLAARFEQGDGVPRDYKVARRWYVEASGSQSFAADALLALGRLAMCGLGTANGVPDHASAVHWLRKCRVARDASSACALYLAAMSWAADVRSTTPFYCSGLSTV